MGSALRVCVAPPFRVLLGHCYVKDPCFDMAMQRQMPPGLKGYYRPASKRETCPFKYPQQETAISHEYARTAVSSPLQGETWKEQFPVVPSPPSTPSRPSFSRLSSLSSPALLQVFFRVFSGSSPTAAHWKFHIPRNLLLFFLNWSSQITFIHLSMSVWKCLAWGNSKQSTQTTTDF